MNSVIEHLPSMYKALGLISSTEKKEKKKKEVHCYCFSCFLPFNFY